MMWLKTIKSEKTLYGLDEVLASYRIRNGSLSKNEFKLVKYQWIVYRDIENLSLLRSCYLILYLGFVSIFK